MEVRISQFKNDLSQEINSLAKVRSGVSHYYINNQKVFTSNIIIAGHDPTHLAAIPLLQEVGFDVVNLCSCENESVTIGLTLALIPEFQRDFTLGVKTPEAEESRMQYLLQRKNPQQPMANLIALFKQARQLGKNIKNEASVTVVQDLYREHKLWYYNHSSTEYELSISV